MLPKRSGFNIIISSLLNSLLIPVGVTGFLLFKGGAGLATVDAPMGTVLSGRSLTARTNSGLIIDQRYTLGPGDRVQVTVFMAESYSGAYEVLVDGSLQLPAAGAVSVDGLTLEDAAAAISQAYAGQLRRPIVTITLVEPRPLRIGIGGEVFRPGAYTLSREGTQFPSLTDALETAGGVTQLADIGQVEIQRPRAPGRTELIRVDLRQLLQTGNTDYNVTLRDGDSILVPTVESFDRAQSAQTTTSSFASNDSQPINVAIVGEVFRPGPYTVTGSAETTSAGLQGQAINSTVSPTVTRAIQVAGGIKPDANVREVEVYRRTSSGERQVIAIDLWNLLRTGDLTEDIVLQEGDTVVVPTATTLAPSEVAELAAASFSPNSIRINIVGEVERPGLVEVAPNTPLNQGILAAGGFNNRARSIDVELIRLNPDGTVSRRTLPIDFAAGIDEANNPSLRNNDVVIVNPSAAANVGDALETIVTPLGRALSLFTLPASLLRLFD